MVSDVKSGVDKSTFAVDLSKYIAPINSNNPKEIDKFFFEKENKFNGNCREVLQQLNAINSNNDKVNTSSAINQMNFYQFPINQDKEIEYTQIL